MSENVLERLEGKRFLAISSEELEVLLSRAELVSESDTRLNRSIRILQTPNRLLIQEYSFSGDILVRPMESREAAEAFVRSRLEVYERMWDGCGCRINFYE